METKPSQLLREAIQEVEAQGIEQVKNGYARSDNNGNLCGLCTMGLIAYKLGAEPSDLWEMTSNRHESVAAFDRVRELLEEKIAPLMLEFDEDTFEKIVYSFPDVSMQGGVQLFLWAGGVENKLFSIVEWLNDECNWSWNQIADWLESIGY